MDMNKIMKMIWGFAPLLLAASALVSCDEHEPVDLDQHVGYILCDDHSVLSMEDFKAKGHVQPVGVLFATATDDRPALAVMLFEHEGIQFTNKIPLECNTSGDVTKYDGYVNSVGMYNTFEEEELNDTTYNGNGEMEVSKHKVYYYSPLGQWVFASHEYGQSDYVPSYSEARLLQQNVAFVNGVIRNLREQGYAADTIAVTGDCWYWTSTEDGDDEENRAWLCSMGSPGFQQTPKTEAHKARAIVALNY